MTIDEEENAVRQICDLIGYGRTMQIASELWCKQDSLGALTVGPCYGIRKCEMCGEPRDGRDHSGCDSHPY